MLNIAMSSHTQYGISFPKITTRTVVSSPGIYSEAGPAGEPASCTCDRNTVMWAQGNNVWDWSDALCKQGDAWGFWGDMLERGRDKEATAPACKLCAVPGNHTPWGVELLWSNLTCLSGSRGAPKHSEFSKNTKISSDSLKRYGWHHVMLLVTSLNHTWD